MLFFTLCFFFANERGLAWRAGGIGVVVGLCETVAGVRGWVPKPCHYHGQRPLLTSCSRAAHTRLTQGEKKRIANPIDNSGVRAAAEEEQDGRGLCDGGSDYTEGRTKGREGGRAGGRPGGTATQCPQW